MTYQIGLDVFDQEWEAQARGVKVEPNAEFRLNRLRSYAQKCLKTDKDWEVSKLVNTAFAQASGLSLSELAYAGESGFETARNLIDMTLAFNH